MVDAPAKPALSAANKATPREPDRSLRHLRSVDIDLNISFHPSDPRTDIPHASMLPEESMKRLRAMEAQVMKWLAANDANKLAFLDDPAAAMQQIDKNLNRTVLKQLRRARRRSNPDRTVDSRVRLTAVRVALEPKPLPAKSATAASEPNPPKK